MRVLQKRGEVIHWAGAVHAYPVLRGAQPELARAGDEEAGSTRVGWREFFTALEHHHLVAVVEDPGSFEHQILPRSEAKATLPKEAFGPPLFARIWHQLNLVKGAPAPPTAP